MNRTQFFIVAAVLASFFWFFGSVLLQNRSFGFRDAANYYYPLFKWECREWASRRVPLWNPLDNGGVPILADTTSSVLYPGKILFALPVSFRLRFHLYVTLHVLIAAGSSYLLARRWRCSVEASGLAAIAYAFGGSILFQYCNVVFLVGASWLPAALYAADHMLRGRSIGWALTLGVFLALMVLGGDPQAAYHAGLAAALYACLLRRKADTKAKVDSYLWYRRRLSLLAVAATAGVVLALVQILPAVEWTRQSNRGVVELPRNVYEAGAAIAAEPSLAVSRISDGICGTPALGTHQRQIYEFSVGPWHLAGFVWPNIYGRNFPTNERWVSALPGEGRIWTPSLYLGLLPFLLAMLGWRVRRCDDSTRFVAVFTLLSVLAGFGWYGLGWLLHEFRAATSGQSPSIGEPVGGLYWFFVTLLPGYVYFRYPAKLFVVASLGLSILAARGWDEFVIRRPRFIANVLVGTAAISLSMATAFGIGQGPWQAWLLDADANLIFGPLEVQAVTSRVLLALLHTTVLALTYSYLLRTANAFIASNRSILLIGITAVELCIANGWMTHTIPGDVWSKEQLATKASVGGSATEPSPRLFRDPSTASLPDKWRNESDEQRLADVVAWERTTLLPKHHLSADVAIIGSHTTLSSADWQSYLRLVGEQVRSGESKQGDALLGLMSAKTIEATEHEPPESSNSDVPVVAASHEYPRARIVHDIQVVPKLSMRTRAAIYQRTREVYFENGALRDFHAVAVLESNDNLSLPRQTSVADHLSERCEITSYSPPQVIVQTTLASPGCLVVNDSYFPGWQAVRETNGTTYELKIYRTNRLMRGVLLPAGNHRITFSYCPQLVYWGGVVSGAAWLLLAIYGVCYHRGKGCFKARQSDSASAL